MARICGRRYVRILFTLTQAGHWQGLETHIDSAGLPTPLTDELDTTVGAELSGHSGQQCEPFTTTRRPLGLGTHMVGQLSLAEGVFGHLGLTALDPSEVIRRSWEVPERALLEAVAAIAGVRRLDLRQLYLEDELLAMAVAAVGPEGRLLILGSHCC